MDVSAPRERRRLVQRLFSDVVGLAPARREARLDQACGDDLQLRAEVQALLDRHERGEAVDLKHDLSRPHQPQERLQVTPPMASSEGEPNLFAGRYRLIGELGRGAMGVVYKAEDTKLDCFVTLKFLHPRLAADGKARERLLLEARAASELHHPNICRIIDHDEAEDGRLYLVMAYYDGESLEEIIERGPLPVGRVVDIARQIASGLAAAHRPTPRRPAGIVHRDVKPSNVLVTPGDVAIILDFGIAKVAESGVTREGDVLGTIEYMSPEHLREGRVATGTDLWALGVTLYEMLTGSRPFRGDYEAALLYAIVHAEPAPVQTLRPDVPEAVAEVVRRCMEKDPEVRYQTAEEVVEALDRLGTEATPPRLRQRRAGRRRWAAGLGTAVVLAALLVPQVRTAATGRLGSAPPEVRHLAVLPLVSNSESAAVGEGLTLTLTSLLAQLGTRAERPITVVPASEMREIKTAAEARDRFGVDVVVSGDFQQEGGEARLTLHLVDARTLRQLRTEPLSEPASRLPILERRALAVLADLLSVSVSDETREMLTAGGTADAEALGFYLKGRAALQHVDRPEQIDLAIQLFQWALQRDSLYALAHAGLGAGYVQKYRVTKANEWVGLVTHHSARALALESRLAPARTTLGNLYKLTGNYEAAIEQFLLALVLDPNAVDARLGLASSYRILQRSEEAENAYLQAISLEPDNWIPYNDLGQFYLETGRYEEAVRQFERVVALRPDNVLGYEGLGVCYLYQGDLEQAQHWLEQAVKIRPTYKTYSGLGNVYYGQGRYAEEAQSYERALSLDDSDYLVWGNLAEAYSRLPGRAEESIRAYHRAIERAEEERLVSPSNPVVLSDLATYHLELGHTSQALTLLEQVSLNVSSDMYLAYRVAVLYSQLGRDERALEWVREALRRGLPAREVEQDPDLRDLLGDPESKLSR